LGGAGKKGVLQRDAFLKAHDFHSCWLEFPQTE